MKGALALLLYFTKGEIFMLNDDVKDFLKIFRILTYGNSK